MLSAPSETSACRGYQERKWSKTHPQENRTSVATTLSSCCALTLASPWKKTRWVKASICFLPWKASECMKGSCLRVASYGEAYLKKYVMAVQTQYNEKVKVFRHTERANLRHIQSRLSTCTRESRNKSHFCTCITPMAQRNESSGPSILWAQSASH